MVKYYSDVYQMQGGKEMEIGMSHVQPPVQVQTTGTGMSQTPAVKVQQVSGIQPQEKIKADGGYQPTLAEANVIKAIETANKKVEGGPREFQFGIHEKTKQITVKIVNTDTKEVVRELPPEKILDMVAAMCEQAGLFVDEKG